MNVSMLDGQCFDEAKCMSTKSIELVSRHHKLWAWFPWPSTWPVVTAEWTAHPSTGQAPISRTGKAISKSLHPYSRTNVVQAKEVGPGDKIPTAHKVQVHVKHMAIAESETSAAS